MGAVLAGLFVGWLLPSGPRPAHPSASYVPLAQIIESNPKPPIQQNPTPPTDQNPKPPTEQSPKPPVEQNPTPPVEQNPTPPTEK
jgi:hypothetical protein